MALDKSSLKERIITELEGQGFNTTANGRDNGEWLPKYAQAIANAIIDEIQANARAVGVDSDNDSHELSIE